MISLGILYTTETALTSLIESLRSVRLLPANDMESISVAISKSPIDLQTAISTFNGEEVMLLADLNNDGSREPLVIKNPDEANESFDKLSMLRLKFKDSESVAYWLFVLAKTAKGQCEAKGKKFETHYNVIGADAHMLNVLEVFSFLKLKGSESEFTIGARVERHSNKESQD